MEPSAVRRWHRRMWRVLSRSSPAAIIPSSTGVLLLYDQVISAGNFDWTDDSEDGIQEPLLDVSKFSAKLISGGGDGGGTTNGAPTASFTYVCTDLSCDFDGSGSSDSDGSIASYNWNFGDGTDAGSGVTVSHSYGDNDIYAVTLTVTDNEGADGSESQNVSVSGAGSGGFTLSATGYKVRGVHNADLKWSGATSDNVDIYRDGIIIASPPNSDLAYTDDIGNKGGGSYTYQICEADGTSPTCSNKVTVTF